ncbi:Na+/H+ antiporter NhaA [Parendozoicomonas haliclonae]|uniref:Na(+)/H(+) antiporter NhaA n=1 Tax=Parendozoicomonas haliclonae TaxID=1960125 RepID=A0A1X7AEF4_9GAMM|nr:Na+/H+ antiporter NhaA [Parendozoicomonas haliclonae]SMA32192.1 Na(+)/H(+) antiporter NhaA [Parendozoicomonas haliclonae]
MVTAIQKFLHKETSVGILLIGAAILAMIAANTPLYTFYDMLLDVPITVAVGALEISKPMLLWINDGLMALFFLLIGLEVKREFISGQLSTPSQMVLPGVAAVGGMVVPALCYVALNYDNPVALQGWAIPTATDIAFSLGVLALLGSRVPPSLKIFLMALAIIDDLGAIIIIALFYTSDLSTVSITLAGICLVILFFMNRAGVTKLGPYMLVGVIMWTCVLKSGVHATLAGVALAFTIPLRALNEDGKSPLVALEHKLHSWVNFFILPVFAFANAGVAMTVQQMTGLMDPSPLGVITGLFFGKQIGVFLFTFVVIKLGFAKLPEGTRWMHIYGVSALCGIGFTMSLFIGSLAFETTGAQYLIADRAGILVGSFLSAIVGFLVLKNTAPVQKPAQQKTA